MSDLDDLYRIALATSLSGADGSHLFHDPKLVGHIYAAPYAVFSPQCVFVAEDAEGVAGYIAGVPNTREFDIWLEAEWWPRLRSVYRDPSSIPTTSWGHDQVMCHRIFVPYQASALIVDSFPAHLHINLLPRCRGQGVGQRLMDRCLRVVHAMGAGGAYTTVGATNVRAVQFFRAYGFREIEDPVVNSPQTLWFAIDLAKRNL